MAQHVEVMHKTHMLLIEMSEKLDRMLLAVTALETRISNVENSSTLSQGHPPPSLPPKPKSPAECVYTDPLQTEESSIYEDVQHAPSLPYRKRGKTFTIKQLDYMKSELVSVKRFVDDTKTKNKEEKMKMQGSLNSLINTLHSSGMQSE